MREDATIALQGFLANAAAHSFPDESPAHKDDRR